MKNTFIYFRWFFSFLSLILVLNSCKKDVVPPVTPPVPVPEATDVNKFVYNGLKDYYLWVDQVPNLIAGKYSNKDTLNAFLNGYTDPQKLFTNLLYQYSTIDKWSFIVNDAATIDNWIQGISETMGFDFMLARIGSTDNVFGFIRYIYKGSPAEKAGLKRGDLFLSIDDQRLTVANYQTLLFTKQTYKLSFASIIGNIISLNGNSVTMTAVQLQENPIELDTILNVNNAKIGYLVYNGFNADFDIQLNDVFKRFKDGAIDKLVLDLRYNGGGSVQTARYLASMIYGTSTSKIFLKQVYNSGLQAYITSTYGSSSLSQTFTDKIEKTPTTPETPINTLNLTKLYVLTSNNTASASELLINGLKPYLQVINIGTNSVGKYVGSMTVKDWDANGNVNPNHKWAMQPIVVKIANSQGVSDFVNGLIPDVVASEDIANLLPFGDQNETLLKAAINNMKGLSLSPIVSKADQMGLSKIFDLQDNKPFAKQMYINQFDRNKNN